MSDANTTAAAHVPSASSPSAVLQLSYEGASASSATSAAAADSSTAASAPSATAPAPSSTPALSPADVAAFDALLAAQGTCGVRDFFLRKFESDAVRNWDVFYKRNADRFYKDRHYLTAEFPELGRLAREARRERGEAEPAAAAAEAEDDGDDGLPSASPPAAFASSSTAAAAAPLLPIRPPTLFASATQPRLLEVGCGVGNAFFPLLDLIPSLFVYALDCSKNAIQVVQNHRSYREQYEAIDAPTAAAAAASSSTAVAAASSAAVVSAPAVGRCAAWVCDLVADDFPSVLRSGHVDYATLVFVLSAIHPDRMGDVLRKVCASLKPGSGVLFLRDYCHYDLAQLRFAPTSKLGPQWYVRQDGTRSYFFHLAEIVAMLERAGFEVMEAKVVCKLVRNRKERSEMHRRFVQVRARAKAQDAAAAADSSVTAALASTGTASTVSGDAPA